MPRPAAPKGKKLPVWAYVAAAGIGLLLAFFLLRRGGGTDTSVPVTTQTPSDQGGDGNFQYDQISSLFAALTDALAAHSSADPATNTSDNSGGATGTVPAGLPCKIPTGVKCKGLGTAKGQNYPCGNCASGQCRMRDGTNLCVDANGKLPWEVGQPRNIPHPHRV